MPCVCVGGCEFSHAFLASSVFLLLNIFALVPIENSENRGNYARGKMIALFRLLTFWLLLILSWGSDSDLLLSQNVKLFCDHIQGRKAI